MLSFKTEVIDYLDELVFKLYVFGYFGFEESSEIYVDKIINFIKSNIHTFPHKTTPQPLKHFGSKYIFYKSNKRTTWYIFFDQKNYNYLITYITNNFSENAKWL